MKLWKSLIVLLLLIPGSGLFAQGISFGARGGMGFPFAHTKRMDPGLSVEAFYRLDPYEVRFNYQYFGTQYYSVLLGRKHFFSNDEIRPFAEAAIGPTIVDVEYEGLAYGLSPVASLGAELGINEHFSTSLATRYSAYIYFGDTGSGDFEANHALSVVAGLSLWF